MSTPEQSGDALAQLVLGQEPPPPGRLYVSHVTGKITFPARSQLARSDDAHDRLWPSAPAAVCRAAPSCRLPRPRDEGAATAVARRADHAFDRLELGATAGLARSHTFTSRSPREDATGPWRARRRRPPKPPTSRLLPETFARRRWVGGPDGSGEDFVTPVVVSASTGRVVRSVQPTCADEEVAPWLMTYLTPPEQP